MIDEMTPLDLDELSNKKGSPFKSLSTGPNENDYVLQMIQANSTANLSQGPHGGSQNDHNIKVVKSERKN